MTMHTTGTWMWIYVNIWVAIALLNTKFNEYGHKLLNGGSLWCYVIHFLFVVVFAKEIIIGRKFTFAPATAIVFLLTEASVNLSWAGIMYLTGASKPSKKKEKLPQGVPPALEEIIDGTI